MIGRTISQYRILEKLGGGGMGVVYKAHDSKLDRAVTLKFLASHLSKDPEANERFVREAKAASALDHPNICTIYDIGEDDQGQLFIAMAFYEGQTLKHHLAEGLSVDECVNIAVQVAEGLERAHEAGIVHRDIKPPNLMVTDRGQVKILDFGVAKLGGSAAFTKTGSTLGTVAYMSPEQTHGEEVDARTDLWALGVVMYEMLTGQRPFRGDYDQAVVYSILNEEPKPVAALNAEAPEGLVQVVEKLLQKDPAERYQRVEDLLPDLKAFRSADTESVSVQAMEAAPVVPSMWRWVTMGIPVVLILLGGLWALSRLGSEPAGPVTPGARTAIAVLPFEVQGGEDLAYLEEGMVTLLATKLDGAGTLRSVDPKALRGYLARNPDRVLDPQAGREVAVHFGAGSFILGTVLRAGTETQLLASLYDTEGTKLTEAQASFANDEQFMQAVDALAQQLVSVFLDEVDQQMASLATGTTTSFPALKAYLEAEQAVRDERFQQAVEAARQAVEADSTFALGWYLLDQALRWVDLGLTAEQDTAMARAHQYSDGLTDRAKTLIEASGAFNAGTVDEAERLYRSLLATYPDDIEAWGSLGDLLFHYNPLRGRPAAEALPYFQRVLFYDPDNSEFSSHLMLIAGKERDYAAFDSLSTRYLRSDDAHNFGRDLYWLVRGSPEAKDSVMALYRSAPLGVFIFDWLHLTATDHIEIAQQLAEVYADAATSPEKQAAGKFTYGWTSLVRGQIERGRAAWDGFEQFAPWSSPVDAVFFNLLPYVSVTPEILDSLEQRVAAWDTTAAPYQNQSLVGTVQYPGHQGDIQAYALGLLRWRQDDVEGAKGYAEALRQRAHPQAKNDLAFSFARTLEALAAWQEDQPEEALVALDEARLQPTWRQAVSSPIYDQVLARYARAEILYAKGRYEEALPWYTSLHDGLKTGGEGYLGPSYLRRAEIYEHLGETDKAITYYTRFIELWQDADPELQPQVEQARQRLNRLVGDTVREPGDVARPGEGS